MKINDSFNKSWKYNILVFGFFECRFPFEIRNVKNSGMDGLLEINNESTDVTGNSMTDLKNSH